MEKMLLELVENGGRNWERMRGRIMRREKRPPRWGKGGESRERRVRGRGMR